MKTYIKTLISNLITITEKYHIRGLLRWRLALMGRTVPSLRIVLAAEQGEWKPFRDALNKKDKKDFDEMWDIASFHLP